MTDSRNSTGSMRTIRLTSFDLSDSINSAEDLLCNTTTKTSNFIYKIIGVILVICITLTLCVLLI